jgi:hypothetical protein
VSHEPFDIARLRRNWDRAAELEPQRVESRKERGRAPLDALGEARRLLARVKSLIVADLREHQHALLPFVARAEELLQQMAAPDAPDARAREEFLAVLVDLEDLADVFGARGR